MENNTQSESIEELIGALVKVQGSLVNPLKEAENPFFHSAYATLDAVWEAIRKPLADNGLAVIQTMDVGAGSGAVVTTLAHVSGQWIRGVLPLMPVKPDPQMQGSAITYARRYALMAIVGISPEDDDAEAATGRKQTSFDKYQAKDDKKQADKKRTEVKEAAGDTSTPPEGDFTYSVPPRPPKPPVVSASKPDNTATKAQTGYILKLLDKLNPNQADDFVSRMVGQPISALNKGEASEFIAYLVAPSNQEEIKQAITTLLKEGE